MLEGCPEVYLVENGCIVMAPYLDEYFRAKVIACLEAANTVRVYFIDFGNEETVRLCDLRVIPDVLLLFPPLAMECVLTAIRPSLIKDSKGKWIPEATQWFASQTLDQKCLAKVK